LFAEGGEIFKRALKTPFLAIYAKGGENISPKQKDRTTTPISNFLEEFFKNWYLKYLIFFQFVKPS
jgi:hypothetical protein